MAKYYFPTSLDVQLIVNVETLPAWHDQTELVLSSSETVPCVWLGPESPRMECRVCLHPSLLEG